MGATYHKPLYLLPFDHRSSFERGLFGAEPPVSATVHDGITRAKWIIFDANQLAIGQGEARSQCAILVDEEFGAPIARCANELEVPLAMPVERSGQAEFEFQYGDQFAEHIEAFDPTFIKVLVRCNPEGNVELNSRQTDRLARLSAWLHEHNRTFLFELLVPATPKQLELYKGHEQDYDTELRPRLAVDAVASMQAGGVEPHIWKVEGFDQASQAEALVAQARSGGRSEVWCIVLGRGADWDHVARWIKVAATVDGFEGFAVGRTLWNAALVDHLAGRTSAAEASQIIADRYLELIRTYEDAAATCLESA